VALFYKSKEMKMQKPDLLLKKYGPGTARNMSRADIDRWVSLHRKVANAASQLSKFKKKHKIPWKRFLLPGNWFGSQMYSNNVRGEFVHAVERATIALYRLRDLVMRANNPSAVEDAMADFVLASVLVQDSYRNIREEV
jgi:hypothetical protein